MSGGSPVKRGYVRPLNFRDGVVDMGHGAGGRASAQLIEELFVAAFDNPWLRQGNDGAAFSPELKPGERMVMATDAHVVSPLFFPGGDIGSLSVHGTLNDVAMGGARPLYLSASFIIEEGFALADLKRIVESMGRASREAGVPIITGDTKVVGAGQWRRCVHQHHWHRHYSQGGRHRRASRTPWRCDPGVRQHRRTRCGDHVQARRADVRDRNPL